MAFNWGSPRQKVTGALWGQRGLSKPAWGSARPMPGMFAPQKTGGFQLPPMMTGQPYGAPSGPLSGAVTYPQPDTQQPMKTGGYQPPDMMVGRPVPGAPPMPPPVAMPVSNNMPVAQAPQGAMPVKGLGLKPPQTADEWNAWNRMTADQQNQARSQMPFGGGNAFNHRTGV